MGNKKRRQRHRDMFLLLGGYIGSMAWRYSRRSILYQEDDLVQEARLTLWRCLNRYPKKGDEEITRIFKTSWARRLASLFRRVHVKTKPALSMDQIPALAELAIDRKLVMPWTFYQDHLKWMEHKLGRRFLHLMVNHQGRPSHSRIGQLKEAMMNRF